MIRVLIEIGHRIEHAWLYAITLLSEQVHDGSPGESRKSREMSW